MKHPHADILHAIINGEVIQRPIGGCETDWWEDISTEQALYRLSQGMRCRIKPRIILINGIEVPEPMRVAPANQADYFFPHLVSNPLTSGAQKWDGTECEHRWLQRGLVHATREAAEAHARALLSFTEVKRNV